MIFNHIGFVVNDLNKMRKYGFIPTMKVGKAVAFGNIPFTFLMNSNTGLIELLETK